MISGTISIRHRWLFRCALLGRDGQVSVAWCEASSSVCGPAQFADLGITTWFCVSRNFASASAFFILSPKSA